jgi:hypothetical protein
MNIHACVDCIHFIPPQHKDYSLSRCGHEFEVNFVTGERDYKFCESVRKYGPCYPHAVFFEPKQDPREQERDDNDGEPF